jgi:glycosyltransferase involved in cell wall biosynthesis
MILSDITVGVVVPMFNAQRTIGATLESVCHQTYAALDIVVVDDGSTDESASIVAAQAAKDRRIRLLSQSNGGVAAARNFGASSTDAAFLAFIDADDLWAPRKIALQMRALQEGGPAAGLAYCWFAHIDEESLIFSLENRPTTEGHVLQAMCKHNFVGNGSSMLLRRSAFDAAGRFDPSLRARRAQGCEDLLMCLRVAERFEFRVVPQHLVGYRISDTNMSSDVMQMLRSCEIVLAEYTEKYPQFREDMDAHLADMMHWLTVRALVGGNFLAACDLLKRLVVMDRAGVVSRLPSMLDVYCRARLVPRWLKARLRRIRNDKAEFRSLYTELT